MLGSLVVPPSPPFLFCRTKRLWSGSQGNGSYFWIVECMPPQQDRTRARTRVAVKDTPEKAISLAATPTWITLYPSLIHVCSHIPSSSRPDLTHPAAALICVSKQMLPLVYRSQKEGVMVLDSKALGDVLNGGELLMLNFCAPWSVVSNSSALDCSCHGLTRHSVTSVGASSAPLIRNVNSIRETRNHV